MESRNVEKHFLVQFVEDCMGYLETFCWWKEINGNSILMEINGSRPLVGEAHRTSDMK